jgi:two-component sensor histidine kinase
MYFASLLLKFLLLILLAASIQAQPTTVAQADSLRGLLRQGKADTNRVQLLLKLSEYYQRRTLNAAQNRDTALVLTKQAGELSQQLKYSKGQEEATFLEGKIYIKGQKKGLVQQLLARGSVTNRIRLLLELGKNKLRPTYTQNNNPDSALLFFRQAQKLSESIHNRQWNEESQALIGATYFLKGDWPQGKRYFMRVIEARQKAGDKAGELKLWLQMATTTVCMDCQEHNSALARALALARQIGDQAQEALILLEIGNNYANVENTKQAEEKIFQAIALQKSIGYRALCKAYHALAEENVYFPAGFYTYLSNAYYVAAIRSQNTPNQFLFYILEAVKSVEQSGLTEELDYAYFRLGNAYFDLNEFGKSIKYHQQSLAISRQKGEVIIHMGLARRLAISLIKSGKAKEALQMLQEIFRNKLLFPFEDKLIIAQGFGACYSALKQYKLAEKYYLESIAWSKQGDSVYQYQALYNTSEFYVITGQYTKADLLLQQVMNGYGGMEGIPDIYTKTIHLMRFKVDSALANYPSAIKHYQLYTALKDSNFNETQSKQIAQLSIGYETEKKEQDIKLKEKNIALLREQNKAQQTQRNALIGGTGLLLALLALSYNRFRLKIRSNQLLEAQQAVLQTQQKVIHEKNGHLSELLTEKDNLIGEKDNLLMEKDTLLMEKDLLLTEKEWLLKEIHHRVKNNLQVVMSLLDSQADSLQDKAALSAIQESQHRVQAMALIHQKLYQSESLARIPMNAYIEEVVAYLHDSYSLYQPIGFDLLVEDIELDVTLAVPLGLIINEAITNAFKYAFPEGRRGTLTVHLQRVEEASYQLVIADDGVGLPASYDPTRSRSLGMTLIHGFSRQLGGKLTITSPPGMCIRLLFEEEQLIRAYA